MIFYNITISSFLKSLIVSNQTKKLPCLKAEQSFFSFNFDLQDKHSITVSEEIILFFYSSFINFFSKIITYISRHHHIHR